MAGSPIAADLLERALALHRRGATAEAAARYRDVLRADPANADAHYYLAAIACQAGRFAEGADAARRALAAAPDHARAHVLLGRALAALGRHGEALASFERAIALKQDLAAAYGSRADALSELGRYTEALVSYDAALARAPDLVEDRFNRGVTLSLVGRHGEALADFDTVIAARPGFAPAQLSSGKALFALGRVAAALAAADEALRIDPGLAEAWLGRGHCLAELKRYAEAVAAYDRALQLKPGLEHAAGARLQAKLYLCDWTDFAAEAAQLVADIRAGKPSIAPFAFLALPGSAADQLRCARLHAMAQPRFAAVARGEPYAHDRLRVAYLSADFRDHPTAALISGLFEQHDRSRFEVTAVSFGPDDNSPARQRIARGVEHFADVCGRSDDEIAALLRSREIDIAIDLMGYTAGARPAVLARRPAPVQINYLGYPGTMGADYIDYILADPTVIPAAHCDFYSERVVWLPGSYQINDDKRPIAEGTPTRRQCGLPETGFVFCCFNNPFKINPTIFDVWMRLLRAIEGSVLWLFEGNAAAAASQCRDNLRREASRRGVAPDRLIFAPRAAAPEHLARHRLADLFLDTLPYNAHTTASDALWTGLPLVTCSGETFAGRVAASLLKAVGLDEMIVETLAQYEAMALALAREPARLAAVKEKLARQDRAETPFDTVATTRQIEAAYAMVWQRHCSGMAARSSSGDLTPLAVQ